MRLFWAAGMEKAVRRPLQKALAQSVEPAYFPLLKPIAPRNWHLTLAFLGDGWRSDRLAPQVERLREVAAAHAPFELTLSRFAWFPDGENPVVLAALPEESEALASLQGDMLSALSALSGNIGMLERGRPYRPHVSVARIRRGALTKAKAASLPSTLEDRPLQAPVSWHIQAIALYRSVFDPQGVWYDPLHTLSLG